MSEIQKFCHLRLPSSTEGERAGADCHFASCPVSAVRTMSGFPLREAKEDACCIDLDPSRNSSMNLAGWRAVEEFASSGRRAHSRETCGR